MKLELTYRGWTQKREHLCNTQSNTVAQMLSLWCLYPCYVIMCEAIVCNVILDNLRVFCVLSIHMEALSWYQRQPLFTLCVVVSSQSHSYSWRHLVDPQHQQGRRRKIHLLRRKLPGQSQQHRTPVCQRYTHTWNKLKLEIPQSAVAASPKLS